MKNVKKFLDFNLGYSLGYQLNKCSLTVKFKINYVLSNRLITRTKTTTSSILNTRDENKNSNNSNSKSNSKANSKGKAIITRNKTELKETIIKLESFNRSYGHFKMDLVKKLFNFYPKELNIDKLDINSLIESIEFVVTQLMSVTDKGYLNNQDLSSYPIISDLIEFFTEDDDYIRGKFVHISFKWLYNMIYLSIYNYILEYEKQNGFKYLSKFQVPDDSYYNLIELRVQIYQKLDPSIRKSLQKRGITLLQNIETGFDTEYVNQDLFTNKLLSVQLAQVVQFYLKLPLINPYELRYINPSNEAEYPVKKTNRFAYNLVEGIIDNHIVILRRLSFGDMDTKLLNLINLLKQEPYLFHQVTSDNIIFKLPTTPVRVLFKLVGSEGYSLTNFLEDSVQISYKDIIIGRRAVIENIKSLIGEHSLIEASTKEPKTENRNIGDSFVNSNVDIFVNSNGNGNGNGNTMSSAEENDKFGLTKIDYESDIGEEVRIELKSLSRKYHSLFSSDTRISVSYALNNVLIGHHTSADLSLLKDFENFKSELDLVNKSLITLGKGFRYGNYNVIIRDTMLLAPASQKSLASIGKLYNFEKIELSEFEINHMDVFLANDPVKYKEYAMKDSLITLKHAIWMENFYFKIGGVGVPTTLSNIGNKYVKDYWSAISYPGYQLEIAPDYLIGEASILQTPIGLSKFGDLGLKMSMYISNYKGGRNESFMFGVDINNGNYWFDYDLVSAYTTVLFKAGHPDYKNGVRASKEDLKQMSRDYLIYSYTIIKCNFRFPETVKYPSIPVYVDGTSTVYPLEGEGSVLTGAEYLIAKAQGCDFEIDEIYTIPFFEQIENESESKSKSNYLYPFKEIITEIQSKRREHPKGTIANLMYKEIGNSIYGSVVRGMSDKRKYDNKSGKTVRMRAHFLTNPIIASWITSYIRCVIGECLHNVHLLGGKVVSVTTDGFITNITDLETEILNNPKCEKTRTLLENFIKLRKDLSGDETALELKNISNGIISWTTRGQLGVGSNLRATTGFQNKSLSQEYLIDLFCNKLDFQNNSKDMEYVQTSLRTATEILKHGGHVTRKYRDQRFSLVFDNRREILDEPLIDLYKQEAKELIERFDISKGINIETLPKDSESEKFSKELGIILIKNEKLEMKSKSIDADLVTSFKSEVTEIVNYKEIEEVKNENFDGAEFRILLLLDSDPLIDSSVCFNLRSIAHKFRINEYNRRTSISKYKKYKDYKDTGIRNFIKGILSEPPLYPGIASELRNYSSIIEFIKSFDPSYRISKPSLSQLRNKQIVHKQVPKTDETTSFIEFVKTRFPTFDESKFFHS